MKSVSKFAYDYTKHKGEINSGEVLVEKDCTMSIKEIVSRFAKGMPIDVPIIDDSGEEFENDDIDNLTQPAYDVDRCDVEQARLDFQGVLAGKRKQSESKPAEDPEGNQVEQETEKEVKEKVNE